MREKLLQLLEANLKAHTFAQREASVAAILEFYDALRATWVGMDYDLARQIVIAGNERIYEDYQRRSNTAIMQEQAGAVNDIKSVYDAHLAAS